MRLPLKALVVAWLCASAVPAFAQTTRSGDASFTRLTEALLLGGSAPLIDLSQEDGWLAGLAVSGYLQNTSGMWVNSSALTNFSRQSGEHHGANSLAVEREQIQLDLNYRLDAANQFFMRFSGVYEPPYPWEANNIIGPAWIHNHSQSEIYNRYEVRDAYWKTLFGPLTLISGRQIVTWGESIAFRVGDVVNPQDLSWSFGFANLEQSRIPLWMIHPILSLPALGPFSTNFIEAIWNPAWQPLYTGVSYADRRYAGSDDIAGSVNLLSPSGGRFDPYPYPFMIPSGTPPGAQAAYPQIRNFVS